MIDGDFQVIGEGPKDIALPKAARLPPETSFRALAEDPG